MSECKMGLSTLGSQSVCVECGDECECCVCANPPYQEETEPAHKPDLTPAALFLGTIISGEDPNKYLGKTVYKED